MLLGVLFCGCLGWLEEFVVIWFSLVFAFSFVVWGLVGIVYCVWIWVSTERVFRLWFSFFWVRCVLLVVVYVLCLRLIFGDFVV